MEFRHLRYFATVVAEGSIHRAAARLNVAQSALSRQIRDVEDMLGVSLLIRSAKGVKPSPAGEVLLAEAKQLLLHLDLAKTRTQRAADGRFGLLRVGLATAVGEMPFVISAFAKAQRALPEVDFSLELVDADQHIYALMEGKIDIGLFHRRTPFPPDLLHRDLRVDGYRLLVANNHELAKGDPVRLADLRNEKLIAPSADRWPGLRQELLHAFICAGVLPRFEWDVGSEGVAINLIAEGLAVGFFSSSLAHSRQLTGCALLPVEDLDVPLHLAAVWRRERQTPAILQFVDLLLTQASRTTL